MSRAFHVRFAQGAEEPLWPLDVATPSWPVRESRRFGARRIGSDGRTRHHCGIDLGAPFGTNVVATESGTVVKTQKFLGDKAHALLFETDTGIVILYGEIYPGSWTEMGANVGDRLSAGDPVGYVGITPGGSSMLHFETYRAGTRSNKRWYWGQEPPAALLDPTDYLERAARPGLGRPVPESVPVPTVEPPGVAPVLVGAGALAAVVASIFILRKKL